MKNLRGKDLIREVLKNGATEDKLALFSFTVEDSNEKILKKFKLFTRYCYPRYFQDQSAPFHDDMVLDYMASYKGENRLEIGFRGCAKTTLKKLFDTFAILNDRENYRKYIKVLTKDGKNSRQIVTDVYNLIIEVRDIYGDVFEKEGDKKREESMSAFITKSGVKYASGTIGQTQRGHVQDAFRPDWLWFDDVEDRESVSSIVITESIINRIDEAITGLSFEGSFCVTANYISDAGVVEWIKRKPGVVTRITPIVIGDTPTWDRYTPEKIEKLKADAEDWAGEFLCDPQRVGSKFFDIDRVERDLANCRQPDRQSGLLRYWANFEPHKRYGVGVDLSDGVGKDSCALALFNFTTGELVATADDNNTAPDLFTYEAIRAGQEFGNAIIAPEVNNTCGGIATRVLKEKNYPNIYTKEITDGLGNKFTDKIGWHTNSKSKPDMFYEFKKDYDDGHIKIYDERVLKEMKAFTNADLKDSRTQAVTRHFDLLTSVCIAWQMRNHAQAGASVKDFYANLKARGGHSTSSKR